MAKNLIRKRNHKEWITVNGNYYCYTLWAKTKEALKPSPEYGHQREKDRKNKEGLDQNQANVAESIESNVTATTPNRDSMPKRDPNDGGKKQKFGVISSVASVRAGLELTNPDPSKNAVEAHTQNIQRFSEKKEKVYGRKL